MLGLQHISAFWKGNKNWVIGCKKTIVKMHKLGLQDVPKPS